jgi:PAS domain S-box-containing protein
VKSSHVVSIEYEDLNLGGGKSQSVLWSIDRVPIVSSILVFLLAVLSLAGWAFDVQLLKGFSVSTMKMNTACGFILGGISLLTGRRQHPARPLGLFCAVAMTAVGVLTLAEYLFGSNFGIDQLLIADSTARPGMPPGRMAIVTATNTTLLGMALLMLCRGRPHRVVQAFVTPAAGITFLSLAGYLFSSNNLTRLAPFESMALNSTIAFALLCTGIIAAIPEVGLVAAMRLPGLSGAVARRLVPAAVLVPLVVGYLRLRGQQSGLYGTEFGIAIFAITITVIMVLLILWCVNIWSPIEIANNLATQELLRQRDALRSQAELINLANDAIIIANADRVITAWNGGAEKLYGWKESEAIGQVIHKLLNTISLISTDELDRILRTRHRWEGELIHTRRDGTRVAVDSRHILRDRATGEPGSFLEINRDITDRKDLQEQLVQSQKLESLGQLAGGVAHDFNNLLTIILGYSEFILEDLSHDHPIRAEIEEISKAGVRASALTRQLLLFSRRQINAPVNMTLNASVLGIEKMLRRLIREDIDLSLHLDQDPPVILADPGQMEQILMNLVVNARDAMPNGGKLVVETSKALVDAEYVETHIAVEQGRYAVLAVSDTGTGMTPEVKARIFEPFFTTKEQGKGTGLGLSTVYGIVKQTGGGIFVYSEPGLGSTFKMFFPAVEGSINPVQQAPVSSSLDGNETILLAEDEEPLRKYIQEAVTRHGYKILVCNNGREAIDMASKYRGRIDVLLSDVVMPEMGGQDLAAAFTSIRPGVPIILMSGYTDRMWRKELNARLIHKPFTPTDLLVQLRATLAAKPQ